MSFRTSRFDRPYVLSGGGMHGDPAQGAEATVCKAEYEAKTRVEKRLPKCTLLDSRPRKDFRSVKSN